MMLPMACTRCGLQTLPHSSAAECAVALRQKLQSLFGELEIAQRAGSYDPSRLETFERETRRLFAKVAEPEKAAPSSGA
jgi:hypothetical protein